MKRQLIGLGVAALMFGGVGSVSATVVNFDDIDTIDTAGPATSITDGYAGFDWNMYVISGNVYPNSGYDVGTVSGDNVAYYTQGASITSMNSFDFIGAYFTSAWESSMRVYLQGFSNGQNIYTASVDVTNTAPTWYQADFQNIDTLYISSMGSSQFAMDDFTYTASPVPEPATMLLFGTGLIGLAGSRLRRKKK